jgi:energy-coupling factor transporter ATP-binding protein EcfA2
MGKERVQIVKDRWVIDGEDFGPVKKINVDVNPGLNVFRGANGSGKSTLLNAVNYVLTKTGEKPEPRDGTRVGRLKAFGVTATFTSRATLKGSLEVESLSGRLDLGDLISPGYESEEVNDDRRIKRLIELSGAQATPSMFAGLLDNMKIGSLPTDLIDAADFVKRLLQEQAREQEVAAQRQQANAAAARQAAAGVDVTAETDAERLQEAYAEAAADLARLTQQKAATDQRIAEAADARQEIAKHKSQLSLADAQAALETAKHAGEEARENATSARQEAAVADDALRLAWSACKEAGEAADNQLEAVEKCTAEVQRLEQELAVARAELKSHKEGLTRCDKRVKETAEAHQAARKRAQEASVANSQSEAALHCAVTDYRAAESQLQAVKEWQQQHDAWQASIEAGERLEPVDPLAIDVRKTAVTAARKAMESGALARKAKEQLAAAEEFEVAAKAAAKAAEKLRANAAATDDVLAAELQRIGCPWRPIDMPKGSGTVRRLVVGHRRGEQTLVSDLSEGERAKHAIDVALSLAGKSDRPAVLILRQEVFEGLQPAVRALIDQHAKERGVVILTAEATDDEEVTL